MTSSSPIVLSHSQMSVYHQCSQKWYKLYVEKKPQPTSPALAFGSDLHKLLAACLNIAIEDIPEYVSLEWGEFREYGKQVYTSSMVIEMLMSSMSVLEMIGIHEILDIEVNISTETFRGILDLTFVDEGGNLWVWDWKTAGRRYKEDALRNHLQLSAYAYLFETRYGKLPDYVGLGVIHKPTGECLGMKTTRTRKQVDEWIKYYWIVYETIEEAPPLKNADRCNDWGTQCPFFGDCWGEGEVEVIDPKFSGIVPQF